MDKKDYGLGIERLINSLKLNENQVSKVTNKKYSEIKGIINGKSEDKDSKKVADTLIDYAEDFMNDIKCDIWFLKSLKCSEDYKPYDDVKNKKYRLHNVDYVNDGYQVWYKFDNGYGALITQHSGSSGSNNLWYEIHCLQWVGKDSYEFICDTSFVEYAYYGLPDTEIEKVLIKIKDGAYPFQKYECFS